MLLLNNSWLALELSLMAYAEAAVVAFGAYGIFTVRTVVVR